MAKLRGAKKAAFLRRMARGRAKAKRGTTPRRRARRVTTSGVRRMRFRRRNPLQALIANPSWVPAIYGGDSAARKVRRRRKKARKGTSNMAKKRRRAGKRRARRAAPRRRRVYRRRPVTRRRRRRGARAAGRRVRRLQRGVIYVNGRGRRRGRRVRRRRNPGFGGIIRRAFVPYAAGMLTAGVAAMLDTGLAKYPVGRQLAKVGAVVAIAYFGRRHPNASAAAIGALGASQGYPLVTKLAGGLVARTPAEAVKGMGEMAETYPEMGALLAGGVGALLNGPSDVPEVVSNYETALSNMSDYGDE